MLYSRDMISQNQKYYLRLGVKDVDSNLMAKTLLNLDKEISGPASGLIEINTDKRIVKSIFNLFFSL